MIELDRSDREERRRREAHARTRDRRLARHVAIAGFMGAGKSTLGRLVAERLDRRFVDTDAAIEQREGCPVWELFARGEEPRFRRLEHELVLELLDGPPVVMALGGGTLDDPVTRAALLGRAFVVHLAISWPEVRDALPQLRTTRPMLQRRSEAEVHELYLQRQQHYRRAHLRVAPPREDARAAADQLVRWLSRSSAA